MCVCECECPTVSGHAHSQTFLQATVLAAVSARSVDHAVLLARTRVGGVALLTPPEETLRERRFIFRYSCAPSRSHLLNAGSVDGRSGLISVIAYPESPHSLSHVFVHR